MATKGEYIYIDTSEERTRMQFYFADVTSVNFDATMGALGKMNSVRTALNALTLLNEVSVQATIVAHSAAAVSPNNADAQREYGVKLFWTDNVTHDVGSTFISGVDSSFRPTAGDKVDLTMTEWAALVTAIQTHCVSKAGNAITVTHGVVTGRRR